MIISHVKILDRPSPLWEVHSPYHLYFRASSLVVNVAMSVMEKLLVVILCHFWLGTHASVGGREQARPVLIPFGALGDG